MMRRDGQKTVSMEAFLMDRLTTAGLDYLPDDKEQLQEIVNAAVSVLDELRGTDADRSHMTEAVMESIREIMPDLSDEQARELAGWLVDLYMDYYASVSDGAGRDYKPGEDELYEKMKNDLENMYTYLEEFDRSVAGNKEELQDLLERIASTEGQTDVNASERYDAMTQHINGKISQLKTDMDGIHKSISEGQDEITGLLTDMISLNSDIPDEILERFREVNITLAGINSRMEQTHEEIKSLIGTVRSEVVENQTKLLESLGKIDSSFADQSTQNFQDLLSSLQIQAKDMHSQFADLNHSLASSEAAMLEQMGNMENNFNNSVSSLTLGISGNQSEVLERIAEMESNTSTKMSGLQNDIQAVFQRVSNGKSSLASALLTKNVRIDEDATFQQIYDGILAVPQEIVIGVDRLPGTIEYEYHHHTGNATDGGGCYSLEDVHQHTGSCYVTCRVVESGCHSSGNYNENGYMHCPKTISHSYCWNGEKR